jgi:RHS repeat-associated protein
MADLSQWGCSADYPAPDKLNVEFASTWILGPASHSCIEANFAIMWNGSQWRSLPSPLVVRLVPGQNAEGGLELTASFTVNDGACQGGASQTNQLAAYCESPTGNILYTDVISPECCGETEGERNVDVYIGGGTTQGMAAPPKLDYPCRNPKPDDCCPPVGQTPGSGSGPDGGQHGGSGGGLFAQGTRSKKCCPAGNGGSETGCSGTKPCPPTLFSRAPVRYASGEIALSATDIASDGFGVPWGHTRSFANRLEISESLGHGYNWQVEQWPYLIQDYYGNIVVLGGANTSFWFTKSGDQFIGEFDIRQTLEHDAAAQIYRFHNRDGSYIEFDDFSRMFQRYVDPAGNEVRVTSLHDNGFNFTQVERTYTSGGTTTIERYDYQYTKSAGNDVLQDVRLSRRVGGGVWTNVSRATYTYFGAGETDGGPSDLKTVTTQTWDGSQWQDTGTNMYRYYKQAPGESSSSSSSSSGGPDGPPDLHMLKYVVNPAAYERLSADPTVSDPLTASDLKLAQYADQYFEYDADRRVTKEMVNGGSQTYLLAYEESENADGYNSWRFKTTETLPSGAQNIVYGNYAGQTMLRVLKSGSDQWCEFWKYSDSAQVVLHANPSAVSGYDETKADLLNETGGSYQYLEDSVGLIQTSEYDTASGYVSAEKIQQGQTGTAIKVREYEYTSCPAGGSSSSSSSSSGGSSEPAAWFTSKETVYPSDTDQMEKIVTSYSYTFYPETCQVQQKVSTLPAVPTAQNGSGQTDTQREYFDQYGNLTWTMDERGFITGYRYDIATGAVTQMIQDVDTSQVTDEPTGWETPTGGGLHLVTDLEHDDQGRITQTLGPAHTIDIDGTATSVRRASWKVYDDPNHEVRTAVGQAVPDGASYIYTLINPVSITKFDETGNVLEEIQAVRGSTSGPLLPSDTFAQTAYVAWTTHQYTECCVRSSTRVYHMIPNSGQGQSGVNYDQTEFEYNASRIMNRQQTPGGTITFTVFDARGNPTKVYVGTDDTGATTGDPTGGGATGNNMVLVTEYEYDGGNAGGDGNLTEQTQHVDGSTTGVTGMTYDWRNRRTDTDGEIDYFQRVTYDNLDRVTTTERYDTTAGGNLIARGETKYDDRGRVYQSVRHAVNPSTGAVGNSLTDNTWYDAAGNVIKSQPAGAELFTKSVYDGLGRRTAQYHGYDTDETSYVDAGTVTGDTILEQTETTYDAASNATKTVHRQRYHNATGTGELGTPSSTQPKARVTYSATWQDAIGRTMAMADYGTNGGSSLTRPDTVPDRSDDILVTSLAYNAAGRMSAQTNPGGVKTCFEYDDAGRQVRQVMNCIDTGSSSSSSSGALESVDTNVTVLTAYNADGNVASITAVNAFTGNQVTQYVYGTTLSDSGIASSLLKRAEIYPDSVDADDRITFEYNRQGEVTTTEDQQGTVHSFDYDALGRQTQDRVTTLGTGVDNAVRRIASTFEVRGMREQLTSYDNATVGSGSVVNEVQFAYNDFGQITHDYQGHSSAVNTSTTPKVQYGYASGSDNTIRPTTITYPDGRVITYDYGTSGGIDDALSRIGSIVDDDVSSTHLADYSYLGLGPVRGQLPTVHSPFTAGAVEVDYTEPDMKWTMVGTAGGTDSDTGDIYRGFDRFGRVKDCYWYDYGSSTDVDRIKYGYDRNGNRVWRKNTVAASYGKDLDELYGYDQIDRLKEMGRGDLNSGHSTLDTQVFRQDWALDATGNWRNFREDDDGDGSWDLNQQRSANKVNEISDISETTGPSWVTPVYNRAGNMTTIPKPADPTVAFTATYDAWNRLVKLEDGDDTIAEYEYDGAKRRTIKKTYDSGELDETRHFYYTEPSRWQVIDERVGSSTDSERQFVWGLRYIDDILLRDRGTTGDGTLDERLYGMQDANWNVTSVGDDTGTVQERYAYSAYGVSAVRTASFDSRAACSYEWQTRFSGYRWDSESGRYHIRNRLYHSEVGFWLQRDPFPFLAIENLYSYSIGRPISLTDPSGAVAPIVFVIIVIGGIVVITIRGDKYVPPPPPEYPYKWPGYGHYCGPRCGEPETPRDCLDAACRRHDHCLATPANWLNWEKKKQCELALCKEAYACDCSTSPSPADCRSAKGAILAYACFSWLVQEGLEGLGDIVVLPGWIHGLPGSWPLFTSHAGRISGHA